MQLLIKEHGKLKMGSIIDYKLDVWLSFVKETSEMEKFKRFKL